MLGLRAAASKEAWQHDVHQAEDLLHSVQASSLTHAPVAGGEVAVKSSPELLLIS